MLHGHKPKGEDMFIAANRIRVRVKSGVDLERRFKERKGIEKQPGFLSFELWKLDDEEAGEFEEYLVVSHWDSKGDFQAWTVSDAFKEAHSGPRAEYILGHPVFTGYEVRQSSRVFRPFDKTVGIDV